MTGQLERDGRNIGESFCIVSFSFTSRRPLGLRASIRELSSSWDESDLQYELGKGRDISLLLVGEWATPSVAILSPPPPLTLLGDETCLRELIEESSSFEATFDALSLNTLPVSVVLGGALIRVTSSPFSTGWRTLLRNAESAVGTLTGDASFTFSMGRMLLTDVASLGRASIRTTSPSLWAWSCCMYSPGKLENIQYLLWCLSVPIGWRRRQESRGKSCQVKPLISSCTLLLFSSFVSGGVGLFFWEEGSNVSGSPLAALVSSSSLFSLSLVAGPTFPPPPLGFFSVRLAWSSLILLFNPLLLSLTSSMYSLQDAKPNNCKQSAERTFNLSRGLKSYTGTKESASRTS